LNFWVSLFFVILPGLFLGTAGRCFDSRHFVFGRCHPFTASRIDPGAFDLPPFFTAPNGDVLSLFPPCMARSGFVFPPLGGILRKFCSRVFFPRVLPVFSSAGPEKN